MRTKTKQLNNRKGIALIMAMIFIAVFSTLSVVMVTTSSANMQTAANHGRSNRAYENALSGLEYTRYWLDRVNMPYYVVPADRFNTVLSEVYTDILPRTGIVLDITKDEDDNPIAFSISDFDISTGNTFTATVNKTANLGIIQVCVTGSANSLDRSVSIDYEIRTRLHNVFDFGVATRGPLNLSGNIELNGTNVAVEADVYIESMTEDDALSIIGNSQIAGDVQLANPDGSVYLQGGQAGIGGETGADAIDNHVTTGVDPVEFPVPVPTYFEQYIENTFDAALEDITTDNTYRNIRIPAGTNPNFTGNTIIEGIIYIETPNVVTFAGNADIRGLIVGEGDVNDNSGTNQIIFQGDVASSPVDTLPEDFGALRDETGTFLLAPGFSTGFGGSFDTLNGAIASNGINFFGNAGGTISGSVLNYSDTPMELSGNSDLFFNRTADTEIPAGFGPEFIVLCQKDTYCEVALN